MALMEEVTIPSDPNELPRIDRIAERIARQMKYSAEERDDIAICVSEAVNNAILHGNKSDPEKTVIIRFIAEDRGLRVEILDQGCGFEPEKLPDPTSPENLLKAKGRGIFLIRHLMDEVILERGETGMKIAMVKWKDGGK